MKTRLKDASQQAAILCKLCRQLEDQAAAIIAVAQPHGGTLVDSFPKLQAIALLAAEQRQQLRRLSEFARTIR